METNTRTFLFMGFVIFTVALIGLVSAGNSYGSHGNVKARFQSACGNGICNPFETYLTCPEDCEVPNTIFKQYTLVPKENIFINYPGSGNINNMIIIRFIPNQNIKIKGTYVGDNLMDYIGYGSGIIFQLNEESEIIKYGEMNNPINGYMSINNYCLYENSIYEIQFYYDTPEGQNSRIKYNSAETFPMVNTYLNITNGVVGFIYGGLNKTAFDYIEIDTNTEGCVELVEHY